MIDESHITVTLPKKEYDALVAAVDTPQARLDKALKLVDSLERMLRARNEYTVAGWLAGSRTQIAKGLAQ